MFEIRKADGRCLIEFEELTAKLYVFEEFHPSEEAQLYEEFCI